jgi:hypothetical protein
MNMPETCLHLLVLVCAGLFSVSEMPGARCCLSGQEKRKLRAKICSHLAEEPSINDIGKLLEPYGISLSSTSSIANFISITLGFFEGLTFMIAKGERGMREEDDKLRKVVDELRKERGDQLTREQIVDAFGKHGYRCKSIQIWGILNRIEREEDVILTKLTKLTEKKPILAVAKIAKQHKRERYVRMNIKKQAFYDISEYYTGPASFENEPLPQLWNLKTNNNQLL